ncbi:hypothetical protein WMY93_026528 [Mugilogobius chulae]|uniref:Uncharacterized protein n=1 Tax=Mugilogobius chulae TaxID=88201 RepID=A0AAW0MXN6_9GOBI
MTFWKEISRKTQDPLKNCVCGLKSWRKLRLLIHDMTPELNMKLVRSCTNTSNFLCECEVGFNCTDRNSVTGNCKECRGIHSPTTTSESAPQAGESHTVSVKLTVSTHFTKVVLNNSHSRLIAILCPLLVITGLVLVLILCLGHETCFKKTVKKLCSVEAKDGVHITRDTPGETQQAVPMATANMGPVHVHNPGTVIFSLLGEVKSPIGQTNDEKTEMTQPSESEDLCTVCQPMPSPRCPCPRRSTTRTSTVSSSPPRSRAKTAACPRRSSYDTKTPTDNI